MPWRSWSGYRRMRYKITRGGIAFTVALLLVALAAALSANNLLFLIAAAMLLTIVAAKPAEDRRELVCPSLVHCRSPVWLPQCRRAPAVFARL